MDVVLPCILTCLSDRGGDTDRLFARSKNGGTHINCATRSGCALDWSSVRPGEGVIMANLSWPDHTSHDFGAIALVRAA